MPGWPYLLDKAIDGKELWIVVDEESREKFHLRIHNRQTCNSEVSRSSHLVNPAGTSKTDLKQHLTDASARAQHRVHYSDPAEREAVYYSHFATGTFAACPATMHIAAHHASFVERFYAPGLEAIRRIIPVNTKEQEMNE